ncbi:hypothetical protein ACLB2K_036357 [Fragaria x ananassa]
MAASIESLGSAFQAVSSRLLLSDSSRIKIYVERGGAVQEDHAYLEIEFEMDGIVAEVDLTFDKVKGFCQLCGFFIHDAIGCDHLIQKEREALKALPEEAMSHLSLFSKPISRVAPKEKVARVLALTNSHSHRSGTSGGSENSIISPIKNSRAREVSYDAITTKVYVADVQNTVTPMAVKEVVAISTTLEVIPMVLDKEVPNKINCKKRSGVECERTGKRYLKFPEPSLGIVNVGIALDHDKGKLIISP